MDTVEQQTRNVGKYEGWGYDIDRMLPKKGRLCGASYYKRSATIPTPASADTVIPFNVRLIAPSELSSVVVSEVEALSALGKDNKSVFIPL